VDALLRATVRVMPAADGTAAIDVCAAVIDAGGIVVLPTRRWYMLCADSGDEVACRRIFAGKGRPASKPLALVMPSNEAVEARFVLSSEAGRLADRLWPGDLALLLPWRRVEDGQRHPWLGTTTAMVTRDPWLVGDVAARTRNPPAVAVVSRSDGQTRAEREPALSPAAVLAFVEDRGVPVEVLVDGGLCPLGTGLTVVDCSAEPTVVRAGAVSPKVVDLALRQP
jgi:tRNA A37 threonylcarbamoyladenosine synthetase subunit TsaC/SUA5/YrdC